ncbi:hypothetical protein [Scytonema sp. NUACC21]
MQYAILHRKLSAVCFTALDQPSAFLAAIAAILTPTLAVLNKTHKAKQLYNVTFSRKVLSAEELPCFSALIS